MKNHFTIVLILCLIFAWSCSTPDQESSDVGEESTEQIIIETGFAEVNGTRLYYEVAGSGDPIVLIHGNFLDNRHWDSQFETLATSCKVIRYDVRGFGKSSMPVAGESYSHHDDLKALLEYLGITKAHICGSSMGSAIALDFVLTYPEMSSSFIPVGPWIFGYSSPATAKINELFGKIASVVNESGPRAATDFWAEAPTFKNSVKNPEILEDFKEIGYDYSYWHFLNQDPMVMLDPPAYERINEISLPTLIITAEFDLEACLEIANILEQTIPNALKVVISDAGHGMNADKPEEFNKAILDFINQIDN